MHICAMYNVQRTLHITRSRQEQNQNQLPTPAIKWTCCSQSALSVNQRVQWCVHVCYINTRATIHLRNTFRAQCEAKQCAVRENAECTHVGPTLLGNIWVVGGASEVLRCPLWGSELPGISGKYPRVSGVSIPQISSYIHVTPHLCGRGTLNSVTYQIPRLPYLRPEVHNVS